MKAVAAKTRARLLDNMATRVSFWRIDRSRSRVTSRPRSRHQRGQLQELRAHLEPRLLGGGGVDLEAHPARLQGEVDGASLRGEPVRISDGQDPRPGDGLEDRGRVRALGG